MSRVVRSISFSMIDPYEKELYEYVTEQSKYFSKYVKTLIERDRSGVAVHPVVTPMVMVEEKPKTTSKTVAKGFL